MTSTEVVGTDAEEDRADDIQFAIHNPRFDAVDVADRAVALTIKFLRRDPRFASLKISDLEDVLHGARRDLQEDVSSWIADWIDQIERAAL